MRRDEYDDQDDSLNVQFSIVCIIDFVLFHGERQISGWIEYLCSIYR